MTSRYDPKQGIDGIATLTKNPLALHNIRRAREEEKKASKQQKKGG